MLNRLNRLIFQHVFSQRQRAKPATHDHSPKQSHINLQTTSFSERLKKINDDEHYALRNIPIPMHFCDSILYDFMDEPVVIDRSGHALNKNQLGDYPDHVNPFTNVKMVFIPEDFDYEQSMLELNALKFVLTNHERSKKEIESLKKQISESEDLVHTSKLKIELQKQMEGFVDRSEMDLKLLNKKITDTENVIIVHQLQTQIRHQLEAFVASQERIYDLINKKGPFEKTLEQLKKELKLAHFDEETINAIIDRQRKDALMEELVKFISETSEIINTYSKATTQYEKNDEVEKILKKPIEFCEMVLHELEVAPTVEQQMNAQDQIQSQIGGVRHQSQQVGREIAPHFFSSLIDTTNKALPPVGFIGLRNNSIFPMIPRITLQNTAPAQENSSSIPVPGMRPNNTDSVD